MRSRLQGGLNVMDTNKDKQGSLDVTFTETLQKSPAEGGWTYVVWPGRRSTSIPWAW